MIKLNQAFFAIMTMITNDNLYMSSNHFPFN